MPVAPHPSTADFPTAVLYFHAQQNATDSRARRPNYWPPSSVGYPYRASPTKPFAVDQKIYTG